jgi:IgA Peptidase M64/Beta/Gamma crystallin
MALEYLQHGFLGTVWPQAVDLLSNEIIHSAFVDADARGVDLRVSDTSLNMSALPLFSLVNGQLKLRFPGTGAYSFRTRVLKRISNFPDLPTTVSARLTADMTIDNVDEPIVNVGVSLDSGPLGDVADWVTGWEDQVRSDIKKGFGDHLGFFNNARYDTSVSVNMSGPELVYGNAELSPQKAIDIVMVADGFTATNIGDFRDVVDAFITQITTSEPTNGNEPFFSFRSVLRIWKIEVLTTVPTHLSHRVVTGYFDTPTGSYKTALANLARLDKIGTRAETVDADVVVFMSDRDTFGGDARAMAMGSVVMLPVSGNSAEGDAAVLQHELGHTVLGNLADEYIEDVGIAHNALSSIRNTTDNASVEGAGAGGEAILFVDSDFRGAHKHVYTSDGRLDFADRASSIVVLSGNWQLYRDSDFRTPYPPILGPGLYPSLSALGIGNDAVSAIRHTTDPSTVRGAAVQGQLVLFEHAGYEGAHKHVFRAEPRPDFGDRASSLVVLASNWQLFRDADFNQPFGLVFGRGRYPELTSLGIANDAVSAFRPTTLPSSAPPPVRRVEGQVVLFDSRDYHGAHKHVYGPEADLDFADRTSSIAVLNGNWRGYQDANFAVPYQSVLGPGLYHDLEMPYHGKEPQAPNVTMEGPKADNSTPRKWAKWAQTPALLPEWDDFPIETYLGARYHAAGLWRPAENCKMRHSLRTIPFCAVCREALTLGMRKILGSDAFVVEYTYPSRGETKRAQVGPADFSGKLVHRVRVPETGSIEVSGQLVAGTLPEPWSVSATFTGTGPMTRNGQDGFSFTGRFGDVLRMTISSRNSFAPGTPLPTLTLELRCDLPLRDVAQAAPSAPADLKTALVAPTPGQPFITRLTASSVDPNADDIRLQFEIESQNGGFTGQVDAQSDWLKWTQTSPTVTGTVDRSLGAGAYKVRARALDATGRASDWSAVKAFAVPEPLPAQDTRL